MIGGIYQIKCLVNGKVYVGSAKNFEARWGSHLYNLRKNSHINPYLQRSFNKHTESQFVFEIVEIISPYNKKIYFDLENDYIDKARIVKNQYNIAKAEGGWSFHTTERKQEILKKISNSVHNLMQSLDKETRSKIYGSNKNGIRRTKEEKLKISKALIGIPKSEITKKRMSLARVGTQAAIDSGKRVGANNKGKPANNRKKVIVDDQVFDSLLEAAVFLNSSSSVLCKVIKSNKLFRKTIYVKYKN